MATMTHLCPLCNEDILYLDYVRHVPTCYYVYCKNKNTTPSCTCDECKGVKIHQFCCSNKRIDITTKRKEFTIAISKGMCVFCGKKPNRPLDIGSLYTTKLISCSQDCFRQESNYVSYAEKILGDIEKIVNAEM